MSSRLKRNLALGLPSDGFFRLGLLVAVMQGLAAVALLGVSAWLISRAAEVSSIVYLGIAIVGVRGFAVGRATFRYVERLLLHESAFRMLGKRRPDIFKKLAPFIPAGFSEVGRGETMARVVNDVEELQNLPLRVVAPLVQTTVVAVASTIFLWSLLPVAGLALLLSVASCFIIAIPLSAKLAKSSDQTIAPLKARLAEQSLDLLENQDVYLAYGWMGEKRDEIAETDRQLRKAIAKSATSSGLGTALFTLFSMVAVVAGAWFGGIAVSSGSLPGATLAIFALLPIAVFEVLQAAQPAMASFRKFEVSADRIAELLDREIPQELVFEAAEFHMQDFESMELRSVDVRYPTSKHPVLSSLNFSLKRGETLLLSGESGIGKSTVALLLARLIQPSSGQYLINGKPVAHYSVESVRKRVGLVEQRPTVFLGDVRANLKVAKPSANDQKLIRVLENVGLWQMFEAREGLETQLGDRGVLISGGEAQRLALARAILADFDVLILDEPTANVDRQTADKLVQDLMRVARQEERRAIVLISHEERFKALVDREVRLAK
jgi:ATP-binding cassette, subfamily C, bacterial CydC